METFDLDLDPVRRRGGLRARVGVLLGVAVLVGVGAVAVWQAGDSTNQTPEDAAPEDPAPDDTTPDDDDGEITAVDPGGVYDGLESIGLPVIVEPNTGLVDGQSVLVTASGFTPELTLFVVQCWGSTEPGSAPNCDGGNYVLAYSDGQGNVEIEVPVRRFITTPLGEFDCAEGGDPDSCGIAVANINDYDESGATRTFFDPEVDGRRAALLTVEPTSGISDGDELIVSGSNFVPGETARITQCVFSVSGFPGCFGSNPTGEVLVDPNGGFEVTVIARRLVEGSMGTIDCVDDPYGCRVVVVGEQVPNPIWITYDGSSRPPTDPSYTVSPSSGLHDGDVVHVEITEMKRGAGAFVLRQCVDVRSPESACTDLATGEVVDGSVSVDVSVVREITTADGSTRDCAQPGRQCYLRVETEHEVVERLPVSFAEGS